MSDSKDSCEQGVHSYVLKCRVVIPEPGVWFRDDAMLLLTPYVVERQMLCERCGKPQENQSRFVNPFDLPPPRVDFDRSF